jgi:predicted transposase YbfD/YdcC
MTSSPVASIQTHFGTLKDPRIDRTKRHLLLDIMVLALCAIMCGADTWVDVEAFGIAKLKWFRRFLPLPHGIPSHDTFGDVFARIDPTEFEACFLRWVQSAMDITEGQVVAVDGKTLRRSHDHRRGKAAIHMVSAWARENRLVLGQVKVDDKSNEITAIPALLQTLELAGCIVTIDAIGTQTDIAQTIVAQDADYNLAVKQNQGQLYEDLEATFHGMEQEPCRTTVHDYTKTVNKGHGRLETRECWTISHPDYLRALRTGKVWASLQTLVMVRATRQVGDDTTVKTHYYISSLKTTAAKHLAIVRGHWSVENDLHWTLDIAFREDDCRVRVSHGDENLAILRHVALNLLKQEKTAKVGIKAKRLKAAWDEDYMLRVLAAA